MNLTKGLHKAAPFHWRYVMAHLIDSIAYIGQTPWHDLDNYVPPKAISLYPVAGSR